MGRKTVYEPLRNYPWPLNLYFIVNGLDLDIDEDKLICLFNKLELLQATQIYLLYRYFYLNESFSSIACDLGVAYNTINIIIKDTIQLLKQEDTEDYIKSHKKAFHIEKRINHRFSEVPKDIFIIPNNNQLSKSLSQGTIKRKFRLSNGIAQTIDVDFPEHPLVPLSSSDFIEPIGDPVPDLWTDAVRSKNSNMDSTKPKPKAKLKGRDGLNRKKDRKSYPNGKSKGLSIDAIDISEFPTDVNVSEKWPSNILDTLFNDIDLSLTRERVKALNCVLDSIKDTDSMAYTFGILFYKFGETVNSLVKRYNCNINYVKANIKKFCRLFYTEENKKLIHYGYKKYSKLKAEILESKRLDSLSSTTLSKSIVSLLIRELGTVYLQDFLRLTPKDIVSCNGIYKEALLELYVVFVKIGFICFDNGDPMLDLINPKIHEIYLSKA